MATIMWTELALGILLSFAILAQVMSRQAVLKQRTVIARRARRAK